MQPRMRKAKISKMESSLLRKLILKNTEWLLYVQPCSTTVFT